MSTQYGNSNVLQDGYYLSDGGLETTMIFQQGFDLPHFAAFELLRTPEGKKALVRYFNAYLHIARKYGLNFVLETPTWRANPDWAYKLGYSGKELERINRNAVAFVRELKLAFQNADSHIVLSGNIGPRGDGYIADKTMTPAQAKAYHLPQVQTFARERVDVVTAMTINYSDEGIGIIQAAREAGLPVVISFTVETDGRLPNGELLREAIEKTDRLTDGFAAYFMINCAHPEHFKDVFGDDGQWKNRIQGIRANASTKSHAELDESEILDTGDQCLLAHGYKTLLQRLPALRMIGGCCGTDQSHMETICASLFSEAKRKAS